jgi:hypothetical protein
MTTNLEGGGVKALVVRTTKKRFFAASLRLGKNLTNVIKLAI